ncbi:MAG: DNA-binding protein WhiA [Oscillospiraceae bacterium]|nr:DNA-binding protein WhiA [Oscillospiraceae bacterium]
MKVKSTESFVYKVKSEAAESVTGRKKSDACLLGMLLLRENSSEEIVYKTDSEISRDLFIRLVRHVIPKESNLGEEIFRHRGRLPEYRISISENSDIVAILNRLDISGLDCNELLSRADKLFDSNFGSFMTGVFLSCGRVTDPHREYHLEIAIPKSAPDSLYSGISELLEKHIGLVAKRIIRGEQKILYFKDSENIEDMLTLIGATSASLEVMNTKVYKDIINRVNRATNCDTANLERQNISARKQLEAIKVIENSPDGLSQLSDELREAALLRLKYPEYALSDLAAEFNPPLSRSGVNHRFKRLIEIADNIVKSKEG